MAADKGLFARMAWKRRIYRWAVMVWAVLALAMLLPLAGCASAPVRAQIPVAIPCPPPPAVARPALPIAELTAESRPDAVMRAYAATVEALMGYIKELEILLNGYRPNIGHNERK